MNSRGNYKINRKYPQEHRTKSTPCPLPHFLNSPFIRRDNEINCGASDNSEKHKSDKMDSAAYIEPYSRIIPPSFAEYQLKEQRAEILYNTRHSYSRKEKPKRIFYCPIPQNIQKRTSHSVYGKPRTEQKSALYPKSVLYKAIYLLPYPARNRAEKEHVGKAYKPFGMPYVLCFG